MLEINELTVMDFTKTCNLDYKTHFPFPARYQEFEFRRSTEYIVEYFISYYDEGGVPNS